MEKKTVDRFFMLMAAIVGILLFSLSAYSFTKMNEACNTSVIYNGMSAVMVIGAVLVTISVLYLYCSKWGGTCDRDDNSNNVSEFYMSITSGISLILVILLGVMGAKLTKTPECIGKASTSSQNDKENGTWLTVAIWFMFSLCFVGLVLSGLGLQWMVRDSLVKKALEK